MLKGGFLTLSTVCGLFSVVDNRNVIKHIKYDKILMKTVMKYISKLSQRVEKKICEIFPGNFSIVFDGWTTREAHYVALYAKFPFDNSQLFSGLCCSKCFL